MNPNSVTILFYATRQRFDLTLEAVFDGERDEYKNLLQEGGIQFCTPKGKTWFLRFSEFAFVFEATQPSSEPEAHFLEAAV